MKIISLILVVLILFSGCTSVARVNAPREVEQGVYSVRIPSKYGKNEKAIKYAFNEFVKSKKGESYDAELVQEPRFLAAYYEYKITIPGSIAVENLPKERVFDGSGTELLIYILCAPIAVGLVFFIMFWWAL